MCAMRGRIFRLPFIFFTANNRPFLLRRTTTTTRRGITTTTSMASQQQQQGSSRKIARVVPATRSGPVLRRLVGTVDVDGKGTDHPLAEVDPFMLLDQASIDKDGNPPFGRHPHRGHSVVTILMKGRVKSWDSYTQKETVVEGPASYWVDAGSGIFHDEVTVIPDEGDPEQHVRLLQLWISVKEEDRQKKADLQYATDLRCVDARNAQGDVVGSIRYYVGGPAAIKTPHPVVVAHVTQNPNTTLQFPIDPTYGGFVVNLGGGGGDGDSWLGRPSSTATFPGAAEAAAVFPNPSDVLILEESSAKDEAEAAAATYLETTTAAAAGADDAPADYLVCVGEKVGEPWYKKLVANGAVIAATPEEAREIAAKVEGYAAAGLKEEEEGGGGSFAPFGV